MNNRLQIMLEEPIWDEYWSSIYSRALSRTVAHCCRLWKPDIWFGSPDGGRQDKFKREPKPHYHNTNPCSSLSSSSSFLIFSSWFSSSWRPAARCCLSRDISTSFCKIIKYETNNSISVGAYSKTNVPKFKDLKSLNSL